jgi:predicted  nucleic acid-binding Zn-ribbon protein
MTQPAPGDSGTVDTTQSGQSGEGGGEATTSTETQTQTGTATTDSGGKTFTQAEYEALKARMQAADQRAGKAEGELKQFRDKDLPELQKLQRDLTEVAARAEKAEKDLADTLIANAFLTDNTHEWQNAATALKLLDRSKIEIDSDGNVTGVKDAVEALAKSDAYLLKPKTAEENAEEKNKTPGTLPGNNGGGTATPNKDALKTRFGVMNTRR